MKRSLRLRSETLTQLTTDELGSVAGAADEQQISLSCPLLNCVPSWEDCIQIRTLDACVPPVRTANCPTLFC